MANTNEMVAHLWATQNKYSAKSGNGNLWFQDKTIYSYRTPIAKFTETVDGKRVLLVTSQKYSMTTSCKHMPAVWRAVDYGRGVFSPCFTVPYVEAGGAARHELNLAYFVAEYSTYAARVKRMRDYWGGESDLIGQLAILANAATLYASAFGLPLPELNAAKDGAAIWQYRAERAARNNAPGMAEKRAAERARRAARKEAREQAAREQAIKDAQEAIEQWRNGQRATYALPYAARHCANRGALLRVNGDKLETSLGATVPLQEAIKVFRFVKLCREQGRAWQRNGQRLPVGAFAVDHIAPNGSFRAGCHLIHWPEIEQAARAAAVLDLPGMDTTQGATA